MLMLFCIDLLPTNAKVSNFQFHEIILSFMRWIVGRFVCFIDCCLVLSTSFKERVFVCMDMSNKVENNFQTYYMNKMHTCIQKAGLFCCKKHLIFSINRQTNKPEYELGMDLKTQVFPSKRGICLSLTFWILNVRSDKKNTNFFGGR